MPVIHEVYMKKTVTTAVLLCAFAAGTAHAEEKADPNDPCAMVLCLAGKLDGSSPAECDPMYKSFMSIRKRINMVFYPITRQMPERKTK